MSTVLKANNPSHNTPSPLHPDKFQCAIVVAEWNPQITDALLRGATDTLLSAGVKEQNIRVIHVPGTVELVYGATLALERLHPQAVIVLGCVIRGDTPHFDYVCDSVTQGVTLLNTRLQAPVIFGVLTVDNTPQALDRAGGRLGNKGSECAEVAIKMANLHASLCPPTSRNS